MKKLSKDEARMIEALKSPVKWGEVYLANRDGKPRRYWPHQIEDLESKHHNIVHLDGRSVGKCLADSTTVTDLETGERIRMDALKPGRSITVLGPDQKLTKTTDYSIRDNGKKPCYLLTTRLGRRIEATDNHPFLTNRGWVNLEDLKLGDWLAVPRALEVHPPENPTFGDALLTLLAFLLADGGLTGSSVNFTKGDPLIVDEFKLAAAKAFPNTIVRKYREYHYSVVLDPAKRKGRYNPCKQWLVSLGVMGCRSEKKFIPAEIYLCSRRQIALFLNKLFSCDGWFCYSRERGSRLEVGYSSASLQLAEGINHLLLRLGIVATLRSRIVNGSRYWCVEMGSREQIGRFARLVGMSGIKAFQVAEYLEDENEFSPNRSDRIPANQVVPAVQRLLRKGHSTAKITGTPNRRIRLDRGHPSRDLVSNYAENTGCESLHDLAASDLYWDQVACIEPAGLKQTFDLSVPDFFNFVANDIVVHNSINLTTDVLHFAFISRGQKGLVAAPHQGQLDTLIEEIEFQLDHNPALMGSVAIGKTGKPKIARKPYFRIEFSNSAILYFRPAGAHGDSFRSLHVERIWVDEAAWLSERAWKALRRCLNQGGRMRVYSTPNGLRNTTYYRLTRSASSQVFRWPSWLNPEWNEQMETELLEFYGGRDSSGWQHEVAGEHGKPAYGAFNAEHLNLAIRELLEFQRIVITGEELNDCETEEDAANRLELLLNLSPQTGVFWLGGDLGYTNDPTELVVFREDPVGEKTVLKLILRVHMEHVAYPNIAQTIAMLDHYFGFAGLGVDYGGNGMATVQELLTLDKYKHLSLEGRLEGFHFGGLTTLAIKDGRDIRKRTKELMTSLITGMLQRRQIYFPTDDRELQDEFNTHTYTLRDGKIVYSKGNDHIIDAVRCALLAREKGRLDEVHEETVLLRPVYTNPVFL